MCLPFYDVVFLACRFGTVLSFQIVGVSSFPVLIFKFIHGVHQTDVKSTFLVFESSNQILLDFVAFCFSSSSMLSSQLDVISIFASLAPDVLMFFH